MKCCIPRFAVTLLTLGYLGRVAGFASFYSSHHHRQQLARIRPSSDVVLFAFKSHSSLYEATGSEDPSERNENSLRSSLRKATGFSLTALRATCRAATGISLSAIYLATVAATGEWIRQTTKFVLSIFPPWMRYFVQPFLILYYVPMFILRNLTGPTRRRAQKTHEAVLDSWKDAVQKADETVTYWPMHVDDEGIYSDMNELDIREGVVESIEIARDEQEKEEQNVEKDKK
mmetsp:Transcript_2565/g.5068  ORF Transcript_2565/g.5068 Transcript_2565/m.5068 type:complete len:231 (-) Transcript_2565:133-825(-)|eukprot:scaffold1168_cov167-Amphora_coffeaeformis.AAC.30